MSSSTTTTFHTGDKVMLANGTMGTITSIGRDVRVRPIGSGVERIGVDLADRKTMKLLTVRDYEDRIVKLEGDVRTAKWWREKWKEVNQARSKAETELEKWRKWYEEATGEQNEVAKELAAEKEKRARAETQLAVQIEAKETAEKHLEVERHHKKRRVETVKALLELEEAEGPTK